MPVCSLQQSLSKKTYTPVNNLNQTAKILESNLQEKEEVVNELFGDKIKFEKLKTLNDNPDEAFKAIKYYTNDRSIWFVTTVNNKVNFWCGVKVVPDNPGRY